MPVASMPVLSEPRGKRTSVFEVDIKDASSVLRFVENTYEARDNYRNAFEKEWFTNLAYFLSYQYHIYDDLSGTLRRPPAPTWRVRLVCNRIMPVVRKYVSKAMRSKPIWTVVPATGEIEDQMAAWCGSKLLQAYWRTLGMDRKLIDIFYWIALTGNVFVRAFWDPNKGPSLGSLEDEELERLPPPMKKAAKQINELHIGDVELEVVPPFEIDPDPNADCLENASYILHSKVRSLDYLEQHYGKVAQQVRPDATDDSVLGRYYERRIKTMTGPYGTGVEKKRDEDSSAAIAHQLWINPCGRYPRGAYAVVAGGQVLKTIDKIPSPSGKFPYVHLMDIPVVGRFWGTSIVEHLRGLQQDYNRGRSQIVENVNLMSKPKWLVPTSADVGQMSLDSEPGERIDYVWPGKPEMVQPPQVPESVYKRLEYCLKDIEDLAAVHEVTQARAPSGVRAGVAIAQLQEQDDQMMAPTFLLASVGLGTMGSIVLQLLSQNASEERVVKIVGKDGEVESLAFTGQELMGPNRNKPGVDYFDVECQMGTQLALSRAAKAQILIDLWREGILQGEDQRKKILRALEIGDEEVVIDDDRLDRQAQMRENLMMIQGIMPEVNPYDNDMIHLEVLRRFQKQPEYAKYAEIQVKQMFEQHAAMHAMAILRSQMPPPGLPPQQAQAAVPSEGLAPPPGGGEPIGITEEEPAGAPMLAGG